MKAKVATIAPRFLRTSQARAVLGGRGVVEDCEGAGWLKAVRRAPRMTLYKFADVQTCADRIERGEYPDGGKR
jgi:hypothetical protein